MSPTLAVAADALVAILLVASVVTSLRLSRRMARLKADEAALRTTIGELVAASERAERAVAGLRAALADGEATLRDRLREAEQFAGRLAGEVSAGEAVLGRVARIRDAVQGAGTGPTTPTPAAVPAAAPGDGLDAAVRTAREIAARSSRRLLGRAA